MTWSLSWSLMAKHALSLMHYKDLLRRQITEILNEFSESEEDDDPTVKKYAVKNKYVQRLYNTTPIPRWKP